MTDIGRRDRVASDTASDAPSDRESGNESASVSWLARIASAVGLVLFLGSVGVLGYDGLFRSGGDPVIALAVEGVRHDGNRWHARIRVENTGEGTAARVRVVGELMSGDSVLETAEADFDYLPAGSTQRGGLYFDRNAETNPVRLRVLGYAVP
ncbi:hypothetical protein [Azospirillum doebereinerae]|uniref:hypothetical protein n=1 Tax=Azospirillum doebereinerae TaxID=92933 RepID=UPI00163CD0EF|nr:hypothetical protein [Azospirillum doebereinerae]MCG5239513.1 hypothetical protein [Azospirillum doebereinerae]